MMCLCVCAGTHGSQKRISEPLKLELQVIVNYLMWVLGTKLISSARAPSTLNH